MYLHQRRLQDAYDIVQRRLTQAADIRKESYDRKAKEAPLYLGQRVYLRQRVARRNKIQDAYSAKAYKVIKNSEDKDIYFIEPSVGVGQCKWVNRRELKTCPLPPKEEVPVPIRIPTQAYSDQSETDQSSYDEWALVPDQQNYEADHEDVPGEDSREADVGGSVAQVPSEPRSSHIEQGPLLRRSTRTTAGTHSNRFHEPRSACTTCQSSVKHSCLLLKHIISKPFVETSV